jgi:hypothetical protein
MADSGSAISKGSVAALFAVALTASGPAAQRPVQLEAADCSRVRASFGDRIVVAQAVQYRTVPMSAGMLDVQPEPNGGVNVERGTGREYGVTACITAGAETFAEAQQTADAVRLVIEGGRVRVEKRGPAPHWNVHLIIDAPANARLNVATTNGPIGVRSVSGEIALHSVNGPIGLHDVAGSVRARAQNGPISVSGRGGDLDVHTANGPITVTLQGMRWSGRLDASTQNGPLTVFVPAAYQSGVAISSSGSSPRWNCTIPACGNDAAERRLRARSLQIGSDPVVVRISTSNGPVSVSGASRGATAH